MSNWLTTEAIGRELNVTPASVRRWIQEGAFPGVRKAHVPGERAWKWLVPAEEFYRFVAVNTTKPFADVRERLAGVGWLPSWHQARLRELLDAYEGAIPKSRMRLYLSEVGQTTTGNYEIERLEAYVFSGIGRPRVSVVIP